MPAAFALLAALLFCPPRGRAADWVRGGDDGLQPHWGLRGGLQFAIPPASHGPRGLVRLLYPTLPGGRYDLVNFIAIEPVVKDRRGFSELERSRLDRSAGKRFWVEADQLKGELLRIDGGAEALRVVVQVEDFDNGARVRLIIEQRDDRPDEIALTLEARPESAPIDYGILTATMGNKARARLLWLKDETIQSLKLYADYKGANFAESRFFPLPRLPLAPNGDLLVAITTDEPTPADVRPFPGTDRWYYGGVPVTQYWRMPKGTWGGDVRAAVNGRYTYWRSRQPIPGGIAFENFELVEPYLPGRQLIFGITRKSPSELIPALATRPQTEPSP